jgi:hypothetical protein
MNSFFEELKNIVTSLEENEVEYAVCEGFEKV